MAPVWCVVVGSGLCSCQGCVLVPISRVFVREEGPLFDEKRVREEEEEGF